MRKIELWAVASLVAGCASYPQPTDSLANSTATVRGAQEAGAEQVPDAALHLRLANEQNELAKKLMNEGENERAHYVTMRAQSDAELALSLAREEEANKGASQARASLEPAPAMQPAPGATQPAPQTAPATP